jgi:hypothetical protein
VDSKISDIALWLVISGAISALGWVLHIQFYFLNEPSTYIDINYFKNDNDQKLKKFNRNNFRKINPHLMNIARVG